MKKQFRFYETPAGNRPVETFIRGLDDEVQAKLLAAMEFIEENDVVPKNIFAKMPGTKDLWEVRVLANKNIYRILCFKDGGRLIIAAHGIHKKDQKTPKQDIKTAERRKQDYFRRK